MIELAQTKICNRCNIEYGIECFYKKSPLIGGLVKRDTNCKYCKGVVLPGISDVKRLTRENATLEARISLVKNMQYKKDSKNLKLETAILLGILDNNSKQCIHCKETLPLIYFGIAKKLKRKDSLKGSCKFCDSIKSMAYKKANPEKGKEIDKRYYDNNKFKILSRAAQDRRNILNEQFRIRNPNKDNLSSSNRRASKLQATPLWTSVKYIELFYSMATEDKLTTGVNYHVDHVVPLKSKYVCGLHCEDNLQILEATLNHKKSNSKWLHMWEITKELKQLMKDFNGTN